MKYLMVVPDGPLESIPFGVLVREVPKKEIDEFQEYRDVRWLARDCALTRLSAVSAPSALCTFSEPMNRRNDPRPSTKTSSRSESVTSSMY